MESGDGLIVRLRLTAGALDVGLAARIAAWSSRWGNGQIDLSGRGNLQLRGVSSEGLPLLRAELATCGLLDASAAAEAVRNVIASPLAGLEPLAAADVRPIVRDLERRLAADTRLHALPGKFGFAVDDSGTLGLGAVPADIRLLVRPARSPLAGSLDGTPNGTPDGTPNGSSVRPPAAGPSATANARIDASARRPAHQNSLCHDREATGDDGPVVSVHLDGTPAAFGPVPADAAVQAAISVALGFLRLRVGQEVRVRRMRDLVRAIGADLIARDAGLPPADPTLVSRIADPPRFLGVNRLGEAAFLGVGLPFGRTTAASLAALASAAAAAGARELRLTPWRAILVPLPSVVAARHCASRIAGDGSLFIIDADDARLRVAACPGAPECASASTPVRQHAAELATVLRQGLTVHLSGCAKGCAHPGPAPVTLVAHDGRYDLVRDGAASDVPVLRGLTIHQAARQLRGESA